MVDVKIENGVDNSCFDEMMILYFVIGIKFFLFLVILGTCCTIMYTEDIWEAHRIR